MNHTNKMLLRSTVCAAALVCTGMAGATEKFGLRYSPGIGGSDMTAPLVPGLYIQIPYYFYDAKYSSSRTETVPGSAYFASTAALNPALPTLLNANFPTASSSTPVSTEIKVRVQALLPRIMYMSANQVLGATVGVTALLPLVERRVNVSATVGSTTLSGVTQAGLNAINPALTTGAFSSGVNAGIVSAAGASADSGSGKQFGVGDLEVGVVFRWDRDPDQILFIPNVILPTGKYDKDRAANPGAGNYYTFRPTVQYSHIGDGWDFGGRVSFSMNTKNKDTDYRSGNYLNFDWMVMKSLSDAFRVGLAGYAVIQTTKDTKEGALTSSDQLTVGKRGQVWGVGPALAYIQGAGEFLVEGRIIREFGAEDRPDGNALWLNFAMPLE